MSTTMHFDSTDPRASKAQEIAHRPGPRLPDGCRVIGGRRENYSSTIGGEVGGLDSQNFTVWSVRGRASVPF